MNKKTAQLRIDAKLKNEFKLATVEDETTMKTVMEELIRKWLKERAENKKG